MQRLSLRSYRYYQVTEVTCSCTVDMLCHITPHTAAVNTAEMDRASTGHQFASQKDSRGAHPPRWKQFDLEINYSLWHYLVSMRSRKRSSEPNEAEKKDHFFQNLFTPSLASRYDFTPQHRVTAQRLCPLKISHKHKDWWPRVKGYYQSDQPTPGGLKLSNPAVLT